ncbi:type II secretion system protein [Oceanobacillus massiliensis]|uniref:type II secretion system protein n=1 Tax=Oceanobacillus massiliensis TaxID=1465765 RepID=UPI003019CA6B
MQKNNGFTLIEVLIAASVLFTAVSTLLPLITILDSEQKVLSDRRAFAYMLHDELQQFIWAPQTYPEKFEKENNSVQATFEFTEEADFIKGCVEWINVKQRNETLCMYGLQAT